MKKLILHTLVFSLTTTIQASSPQDLNNKGYLAYTNGNKEEAKRCYTRAANQGDAQAQVKELSSQKRSSFAKKFVIMGSAVAAVGYLVYKYKSQMKLRTKDTRPIL